MGMVLWFLVTLEHTHTRLICAIELTQRYLIHSIVTFYCIDLEEETDHRKDIELFCIEK